MTFLKSPARPVSYNSGMSTTTSGVPPSSSKPRGARLRWRDTPPGARSLRGRARSVVEDHRTELAPIDCAVVCQHVTEALGDRHRRFGSRGMAPWASSSASRHGTPRCRKAASTWFFRWRCRRSTRLSTHKPHASATARATFLDASPSASSFLPWGGREPRSCMCMLRFPARAPDAALRRRSCAARTVF